MFYDDFGKQIKLFCVIDKTAVELVGELAFLEPKDKTPDKLDVAVMCLRTETPEFQGDGVRKFLPVDQLFFGNSGGFLDKTFALVGFPATRNKVNHGRRQVQNMAYNVIDRSVSAERYSELGLHPETHIVLPLDHKQLSRLVGAKDETPRRFPKAKGMSGGPAISLRTNSDGTLSGAVEGIVVAQDKKARVIVCARVSAILMLIEQYFKDGPL